MKNSSNHKLVRVAAGTAVVGLILTAAIAWLLNRPATPPTFGSIPPTVSSTPAPILPASAVSSATVATAAPPADRPPPANELHEVRLALEGKASPENTLKAAMVLMGCKGADGAVETLYRMRDQADPAWKALEKMPGARMDELIARAQDAQRRCQAFDSSTLARVGELLGRAYQGGAKDSALPYLQWINSEGRRSVSPELIGKLQRESRQAAEDGDLTALTVYSHAFDPATLGATAVQRSAYKEALFRIEGEMSGPALEKASRDSMENLEKMVGQKALSAEEQREADALTEKVIASWRKRKTGG